MNQTEVELALRSDAPQAPLPAVSVEPPPPARISIPLDDDLEPYNLPFTD